MTFDASPLPSPPANLPVLPFGTYLLPLGAPEAASDECIQNEDVASAWSCNLTISQDPDTQLQMQVTPPVGESPAVIQLTLPNWQAEPLQYGAQPPVFRGPQRLSMAMDQDNSESGPAFWFQAVFDKLVILEDNRLKRPTLDEVIEQEIELETRDLHLQHQQQHENHHLNKRSLELKPGDKPWFCNWNGTILEGFLYLLKNTSTAAVPGQPPSSLYPDLAVPTAAGGGAATSLILNKGQQQSLYSNYPKVVKLAEHRRGFTKDRVRPVCQQMQVLDNKSISPITTVDTGESVIVYPDEVDSALMEAEAEVEADAEETTKLRRRALLSSFFGGGGGGGGGGSRNRRLRRRGEELVGRRCECTWVLR